MYLKLHLLIWAWLLTFFFSPWAYVLHPQALYSPSWVQWVPPTRVIIKKEGSFSFKLTYKYWFLPIRENEGGIISLQQLQNHLLLTQFLIKKERKKNFTFERLCSWVLNVCMYVCMYTSTDSLFSFSITFFICLLFSVQHMKCYMTESYCQKIIQVGKDLKII